MFDVTREFVKASKIPQTFVNFELKDIQWV